IHRHRMPDYEPVSEPNQSSRCHGFGCLVTAGRAIRRASTAPRSVVRHCLGRVGHTDDMDDFSRIRLEDGRFIDFRVSGPTDGPVLIFRHGPPGAGTPIRAVERAAHARGLRVATTSRPGYGDSSRDPGRSVVRVVGDLAAVLASIGADRCLVAGWSGGGPHAL